MFLERSTLAFVDRVAIYLFGENLTRYTIGSSLAALVIVGRNIIMSPSHHLSFRLRFLSYKRSTPSFPNMFIFPRRPISTPIAKCPPALPNYSSLVSLVSQLCLFTFYDENNVRC